VYQIPIDLTADKAWHYKCVDMYQAFKSSGRTDLPETLKLDRVRFKIEFLLLLLAFRLVIFANFQRQ
jgi:hypothetical protein